MSYETAFVQDAFFSLTGAGVALSRFSEKVAAFAAFDVERRVRILVEFLQLGKAEFAYCLRCACAQNILDQFAALTCFPLPVHAADALRKKRRYAWLLMALRMEAMHDAVDLMVGMYAAGCESAGEFVACMVTYCKKDAKKALLAGLQKHVKGIAAWSVKGALPCTSTYILVYMWRNACCRAEVDAALIGVLSKPDVGERSVLMIADEFVRYRKPLEAGSAAKHAVDSIPDAYVEALHAAAA